MKMTVPKRFSAMAIAIAIVLPSGFWALSSGAGASNAFPEISGFDFQDEVGISCVNGMVDVDGGEGMSVYRIVANINHPDGWNRITQVHVRCWFDEGMTAFVNYYPEAPDYRENMQFHFVMDVQSGFFYTMYPDQIDPEVTLLSAFSMPLNSTSIVASFDFIMYEQVRAAPGPFTEPTGMKYGWGFPGGQSTIFALNDANTWDIEVQVEDDMLNTAYAYDEFGVYEYTYIDVLDVPGNGQLYAVGEPSTSVAFFPTNSDMFYKANCEHKLRVSLLSDLVGESHPTNVIPAGHISFSGGMVTARTHFMVGGSSMIFLGDLWAAAPAKNFSRSTSILDLPGTVPINWWVDIPAVPADTYVGAVCYEIDDGSVPVSVITEIAVTVPEPVAHFNISVTSGWNLVSIPLDPLDHAMPTTFQDVEDDTQWDRAMWYDARDSQDPWKQYVDGWPVQLNDFNSLNTSQGVWLNVTDPGDGFIHVTGYQTPFPQIPLKAGWNLVGYPTLTEGRTVGEVFSGTGADVVEVFDPAQPYLTRVAEQTYTMTPGEGYWVRVPADTIWTVW